VLTDLTALRDDAAARGWHTEVARHSRVIASLQAHLHRLKRNQEPDIKGDFSQGRLIEAQFTALRYFTLNGTDHASHKEQASMIRRYIIWRNNHAHDERLRRIVDRANAA